MRTTFASADTSHGTVKLSCCEHYGNVLHKYSDRELRAVSLNVNCIAVRVIVAFIVLTLNDSNYLNGIFFPS